ncbi:hypothetical protein An16g00480 [Aspergillus niger]|uniref:Uncharacterized protein n=2 Tax=Aspergillus niger TaxID=5061 RepID=A2R6M1_ASPNC|nr:hypothetical protein An16g00480 [Aspergillus niger]CAK42729.1 hypothetical protein An16g00480 [Aspergillus niger]
MTGYCQKAVDTMLPGLTNLTCSSSGRTGNCWGAPDGLGCGVFVAGPRGCTRTTEQMKAAFNNIRAHDSWGSVYEGRRMWEAPALNILLRIGYSREIFEQR